MNFDLLSVATVIANIAIAFTLLEGTALLLVHRLTGHGLEPKDYLLNLMAGFFLMLALRAGLLGAVRLGAGGAGGQRPSGAAGQGAAAQVTPTKAP